MKDISWYKSMSEQTKKEVEEIRELTGYNDSKRGKAIEVLQLMIKAKIAAMQAIIAIQQPIRKFPLGGCPGIFSESGSEVIINKKGEHIIMPSRNISDHLKDISVYSKGNK